MSRLDVSLVRHGCDGLRLSSKTQDVPRAWLSWLALKLHMLTLFTSLDLLGSSLLDALDEVEPALRMTHVLDANAKALLDVTVAHYFVYNHTQSRLGDVEHNTSLAVIVLVRQTLLHGTVSNNVNDITNAVIRQVDGSGKDTMVLETTTEAVTGLSALSA